MLLQEFDWTPTVTEKNKIYKRGRYVFDEFLDHNGLNVSVNLKEKIWHFSYSCHIVDKIIPNHSCLKDFSSKV